jgi:hypothetical protein
MKGYTAIAALAALSSVFAAPSESELVTRQTSNSKVVPITIKGNGKPWFPHYLEALN